MSIFYGSDLNGRAISAIVDAFVAQRPVSGTLLSGACCLEVLEKQRET